jgi:hypothetical protein
METYTNAELDQLGGSLLYIGSLHAAIGLLLDATKYRRDVALIEYVNHGPVGMVDELLPATALVIAEAQGRLAELAGAVDAALDYKAERAQAEADADPIRQTFDELIGKLYPEKKINGLD